MVSSFFAGCCCCFFFSELESKLIGLKSLLSGLGLVPDFGVQTTGPSRRFELSDLRWMSSLLDHFAANKKKKH